jgi:hypothetical protein
MNSHQPGVASTQQNAHRLRFSDESHAVSNLRFDFGERCRAAICSLQSTAVRYALTVLLIIILARTSTAGDLKWQSPRAAAKKPSKPATAQRFVQPRQKRNADNVVRPVIFEEDGPQLTVASEGDADLRSVVVDRDDFMESTRSAQLPPSSTGADASGVTSDSPQSGTTDQRPLDSQIQQQLRDPFDDAPPPLPGITPPATTGLDATTTPPQPAEQSLPSDTAQPMNSQLPFEPAPMPFQPSVPPTGTAQPIPDSVPAPSEATLDAEEEQTQEDCEDSLTKLRAKTISTVNLSIAVTGTEGQDFPFECSLDTGDWHAGRAWPQTTYLWKAAALCHKPLYFEDEQLERYGHSWPPCCQPFVSGAHFFTRLPVLPYCMGVEPPNECVYALGHYRPGSCAPYMCNPIPLSPRGALFQAGAVVGAAAVLP